MFFVIGAGGVGSWLAPALCRLVGPKNITLVDGDTLEPKNLDRQLFSSRDIGKKKAQALGSLYQCAYVPEYYGSGFLPLQESDWLLLAVDNHPARAAALTDADIKGVHVLIGANERTSAEAYYYRRHWQDSQLDPRKYYPDILTNRDDDPMARGAGCTGEAQVSTPQLVSANMMAASLMMHLIVVWHLEARKLDEQIRERLPYLMRVNMTGMEVKRVCDSLK